MFVFLFSVILSVVVCVLTTHYVFKYNARAVMKVPSPKRTFLVGHGLAIISSPVGLFNLARIYANSFDGIYGWYGFWVTAINIYNPKDIETVISSSKNTEKSIMYKIMHPWLREGLLVSKGSKWAHRRKILTPAFHFNILKRFLTAVEETSQKLVENLKKSQGERVNISPVISEYTLNNICVTAMGTVLDEDKSKEGNKYKIALNELSKNCAVRMARFYYFFDITFKLSLLGWHFYKHLNTVMNFTKTIIKERKHFIEVNEMTFPTSLDDEDVYLISKKNRVAMLDLLISAEKDGQINSVGIQEEVDTFMFEGHDTVSSGLDFCLMILANHKLVQDKILEELNEIFGDSDRPAIADDLHAMKYLECCIKESLRLYPPVPCIGRKLSENVVLSGYKIPAGTNCHIHIYDLHRRPDIYPDPEKFDPNRFLPENSLGRHPYAFIPFSAGPRNCIGQRFAMLEMKSCVSRILRKFELHPVTRPGDLEFMADLVLRNTKPIYVKFVRRP